MKDVCIIFVVICGFVGGIMADSVFRHLKLKSKRNNALVGTSHIKYIDFKNIFKKRRWQQSEDGLKIIRNKYNVPAYRNSIVTNQRGTMYTIIGSKKFDFGYMIIAISDVGEKMFFDPRKDDLVFTGRRQKI